MIVLGCDFSYFVLVDRKLPVPALVWLLELVFVDGLVLELLVAMEVQLSVELLLSWVMIGLGLVGVFLGNATPCNRSTCNN